MKKRIQNAFFFMGLSILVLMVTQLDYTEVCEGVSQAGYWFLAVVLLWALLYVFNTSAWWIIIKAQSVQKTQVKHEFTSDNNDISFAWLYKITVSGFALNYATPGGLMGGEPYKIMSLTPIIGTEKATASVILHTMTHIFSHFWFWLLSCFLFVLTEPITKLMCVILIAVTLFCIAAIWFFLKGYKKGIVNNLFKLMAHLPFMRIPMKRFVDNHSEQLNQIDMQVAALHNQTHTTFIAAVLLELACRIVSAFEVFFILLVIMPDASFLQCILILAFTSLFANMLFFIPLQLGGREGGFLMSVHGLGMTVSEGVFVALLVRLRELIWTAIGLLLIKIER